MRYLCTTLFIVFATFSRAQLVNGSFESDGAFSLAGWEWTCSEPTSVSDVPPDGGTWAVRVNMGTQDCSPNYLFQRIPFAQGGSHWIFGGWARADSVGWDALPQMGFSSVNNGDFPFQNRIGNPAPYWDYIWVLDTVHASATDTAVVLLGSGDGFMGAGWFDGLELQPADPTGLSEAALQLHTYLDAQQVLYLSAGKSAIRSMELFDAAGRMRPVQPHTAAPGGLAIRTEALGTGMYIVRAITDAGPATVRFIKR